MQWRIVPVTEENLHQAAEVHAVSWQASHRQICTAEFIAQHTALRQAAWIRRRIGEGARFWLLLGDRGLGVVSVDGDVIADLYVLPEAQRQGLGAALLARAIAACKGVPRLWVLNTNKTALDFYAHRGFRPTGARKQLREDLWELEMARQIP